MSAPLIHEERLRTWLSERLSLERGELLVERISSGNTNEMFSLRSGRNRWLLRRPPRVATSATAHQVAREFRILSALDGSAVPHPRALALCEDASVIGAPFLVMEFVDGFSGRLPLPEPFRSSADARRELVIDLVDVLAALGSVDWSAAGLEGFGKPAGFLERQVDRWLGQLEVYGTRELPHLDEVADWLRSNRPQQRYTGILHGDYQWDNVLFSLQRPGRVAAVVDWDGSTIGDPLLDIGWLLAFWHEPGEDTAAQVPAKLLSLEPGAPTRAELAARYEKQSGRSLEDVDYYRVLSLFKLACVCEGSYTRFIRGESDDPGHANFEVRVPALIAKAATIAADG
jgi:aminoglycoside phosphotransferase (APT) family kinase protein